MITPAYDDSKAKLYTGDAREIMSQMDEGSVNMICTSPPYMGQRIYPDTESLWGKAADHEHVWEKGRKKDICMLCGVISQQFGTEETVPEYISHTLEFFTHIRHVLHPQGTVFWNLGTSYTSERVKMPGVKDKNDALIPYRLAMALQEDGWYVRNIIMWIKINPACEATNDRFTTAYEPVLFLSKNRHYWFDVHSVRQPYSPASAERLKYSININADKVKGLIESKMSHPPQGKNMKHLAEQGGAHCWDVWLFPTATSSRGNKHYAVFPEDMPRRAILSGCPPYICIKCNKPYIREIKKRQIDGGKRVADRMVKALDPITPLGKTSTFRTGKQTITESLGWIPQCKCSAETRPGIVLDPFSGTGTTVSVAKKMGRHGIGIDISEEYTKYARWYVETAAFPFEPVTSEYTSEEKQKAVQIMLFGEEGQDA